MRAPEVNTTIPFSYSWSPRINMAGTIACDIAAHAGADLLLGVIYVAAVRIQAQEDPTDVASFIRAKTEFFEGIWVDSAALDYRFRSLMQTPQVVRNVLQRQQDPTRILNAFRAGKPVLVVYGDAC